MDNRFKSQKRATILDYLGGRSIGPQVMSDEKWEEIKESFLAREQTCDMCQKKFLPPNAADWVYKTSKKIFCSWSCLRKYEKVEEEKRATRRKHG